MKIAQYIKLIVLFLFISSQGFGQQLKENEVVVIHGEKFILHEVRTGETLFSISKQFKTNYETILQYNPKIENGLNIGDILKLPFKNNIELGNTSNQSKGDPTRFEFHTIESRKETPYFIAKNYHLTVEEIYAYNPEIRKFRKGTKLRIPVWENKTVAEKDEIKENIISDDSENELITHEVLAGETVYSISKKYRISESELLFYNPGAANLQVGAKLYLPAKKVYVETVKPDDLVVEENEIDVKQPDSYFEHIIESGETLWRTARKYGVSENSIIALNPALKAGFQAGMVIKIPVEVASEKQVKPVNDEAFDKHYVEKGETLFGLGAKFNMKISEIKRYNPILEKRNLVYGETILIPRKPDTQIVDFMDEKAEDSVQISNDFYKVEIPVEIPESCKPVAPEWNQFSKTYDVALFLPLFLVANDTLNKKSEIIELPDTLVSVDNVTNQPAELDTLIEQEEPEDLFVGFYQNTENYLEFYEGVLMAVDSMQNAGMNIKLQVFDTQRNADSIRKYIYTREFLETDLIIGPVFESVQDEVAEIAAKNQIPFISPLMSHSEIINSNPYYYQVNPSREYLAEQTAGLVAEEYFNSNFIVFKTGNFNGSPEGRLVELIQEKFYNSGYLGHSNGVSYSVYDFENDGPFGLRRILSKTKENVIYVPSLDEGEISIAVSNIDNLADDYSITLIGSNRFSRYESIAIKHFHDLKLEFISPYWVDYKNPKTQKLIEKFKSRFYAEPGSFGMQGFDVSFYFLNALNYYGKNFSECLPYLQPDLFQGTYQFEKVSEFGGYMNNGVSVIKYNQDYEIERTRIKGQLRLAGN